MESSALTQGATRGPSRPGSFCPHHLQSYIRGQIRPKCLVPWWRMYQWWLADHAQ